MKLSLVISSVIALFAATIYAGNVYAADAPANMWEISGGANANFTHSWFGTTSNGTTANSQRSITVIGDAEYFVMPQLEVGVNFNFAYALANGADTSTLQILVGPTFNLSADAANSIFVEGKLGLAAGFLGANEQNITAFAWLVGVGKRFELVSHVSYKPEVQFVNVGSYTINSNDGTFSLQQPSTHSLEIIPLQFSFIF